MFQCIQVNKHHKETYIFFINNQQKIELYRLNCPVISSYIDIVKEGITYDHLIQVLDDYSSAASSESESGSRVLIPITCPFRHTKYSTESS